MWRVGYGIRIGIIRRDKIGRVKKPLRVLGHQGVSEAIGRKMGIREHIEGRMYKYDIGV